MISEKRLIEGHRGGLWLAAGAAVLLLLMLALAVQVKPAGATEHLEASPDPLVFPSAPVGGSGFASVTITNSGTEADVLTFAFAPDPFSATYGGTCNSVYAYALPAGESCTFEFSFFPTSAGMHTASGTIQFQSGTTLTIGLVGETAEASTPTVVATSTATPTTAAPTATPSPTTMAATPAPPATGTGVNPGATRVPALFLAVLALLAVASVVVAARNRVR